MRAALTDVDVLIPVYNAASTVEEAIHSIQTQSVSPKKIILIDDGSTDETPAILRKIAQADDRIVILTQENGGIVDALNAGLQLCTSPYIARHDADDLAAGDRFRRQVEFLDSHPDYVAVSGMMRYIDGEGRFTGEISTIGDPAFADPHWLPSKEPFLMHPFLMVRRSAFNAVKGYRYVFHTEDVDLYWRLGEIGKLHNLAAILGDYRIHAGSISGRSIINGRMQALNSQLAAVDTIRRRSGEKELEFPRSALKLYEAAASMEGMVNLAGKDLTDHEVDRLKIAVANKLMEISNSRPYELDIEDCRFIRKAASIEAGLSVENSRYVDRHISGVAADLVLKGRVNYAFELCPPRLYPSLLARVALRLIMSRKLRLILKRKRHGA
jgi:glycosyltransferase involved in cell wall biosynthesis